MTAVRPSDDRGMILLNVLAVVAVASAALLLMVSTEEFGIDRTLSLREAAQAQAFARGGELSAVAALRRDMVEAPEVDHLRERWAGIADDDVRIEGGRFSLSVADAQDRFNLNSVLSGGLVARASLERVLAAAELPPVAADAVIARLAATGPLGDIGALSAIGLDAASIDRLRPYATALPPDAGLNVNTASGEVLGALLQNPIQGRLLAARREATGFLTPADLEGLGVAAPFGIAFTSDHYRITTEVQVGDTRQRVVSLLRRRRVDGVPEVVVVRRQREAATMP